ncbi:hypothetical protein Tco_1168092, partial [Tanacetum coccineum]
MLNDDLASITGFEIQDSTDDVFEEATKTLHAFADKPIQSYPLGHLHEELCLLNNKVNQLESSITKHVSDSIQSTVPLIVTNTLKEQMSGLLSDALKDILPQLIKDSIKSSVSESIVEELPQVEAQGEQPSAQVVPNARQVPPVNEEKALVLHTLEEKSSEEDTSGKKETDDEPPAKKLKFLIPSSSISSPTPLKTIMPDPPKFSKAIKMTLDQFIKHLSKTTSSIFSSTPPKEPTLPKDQIPLRDKSKGKSITTEDPLKDIMPFMEEGGPAPKISSLKSFVIPKEPLSKEKVMAQLKEIKRLAYLKAEKDKSEKFLKKIL